MWKLCSIAHALTIAALISILANLSLLAHENKGRNAVWTGRCILVSPPEQQLLLVLDALRNGGWSGSPARCDNVKAPNIEHRTNFVNEHDCFHDQIGSGGGRVEHQKVAR